MSRSLAKVMRYGYYILCLRCNQTVNVDVHTLAVLCQHCSAEYLHSKLPCRLRVYRRTISLWFAQRSMFAPGVRGP